MRAMVLHSPGPPPRPAPPLVLEDVPTPRPGPGEVLLQVLACGICRTDLHVVDGELGGDAGEPKLPLVPGHQVVGRVVAHGPGVQDPPLGIRVGVPWLGWTCGVCPACARGAENLCERARFTGYQLNGGFAEYCTADARYCFALPPGPPDDQVAPLLCAGLIGWRCLCKARPDDDHLDHLGLYGFGAAAHILCQVATWKGIRVSAFTRPGDDAAQRFARSLGASWAGGSTEAPAEALDAAIIFAPVGALVPEALRRVRPGGVVVCGGIHMSPIPPLRYDLLWGERVLRSVANLTRRDGHELLDLAPKVPIHTEVHRYRLEDANRALDDLRAGRFTGAAVLIP